ncbi:hypothetical protein VCSRO55_0716 [Vibrio cholerae]|uniref:hypothetical protein n=1 Tax=Vibrio cholerae TaxID=666 RepID=UPI0011D4BF89|nr:hypothetical protein [Vibrio cholerae]EKO3992055.1 hypothetical protein [Vibrio fluvialis]EGR2496716.1 hypothetical protein [Vibrio cholerae]MBY8135319.1 hypothetical protein [Vibrio fluvialis]TXZ57267.1 hypothetical protein FXE54_03015 [Vibrio cholerae]GHW19888.1 hypothetical protein VCSRO55_0716 [Vibrio cholerae]
MSRMQTDEFVWLHGGRVISRRPKGKGELVMSNSPLLIVDDELAKFDIIMNDHGVERHMQAVRLNNSIIYWEA